ncbi:MAG: lipid-A-disaccharide synthase [Xanthomonadaceae bacterium]|nr:lipid-A-disaccharide synthase [Xanthomonadaceae bacterium]MDE1962652.1 lipid-A-disaccharide synthase [Xanthomonadaceae bacterium]
MSPPASTEPHPAPVTLIALVAGEDSGDQLGAGLIAALRRRYPDARFVGIGGKRMQALGFDSWYDMAELSLFGLAEVLGHLPRLLRLRRELLDRLIAARPAVVVGIDAPDFNLGLERRLREAGLRTVHYVSPSVWAWREKRAAKIGRSADRVLCLFPMEPPIYARHGIDARFVGHPLADRFPMVGDRHAAREALGLAQDRPVLAVLPGSRGSEIDQLGAIFLDAAARVAAAVPGLQVVIPSANARMHERIRALLGQPGRSWPEPARLTDGLAHEAMLAADVVLLASGTATLEAMLAKRPMVVGYRVSPWSYRIARLLRMLKTDIYSLPNVLARASGLGGPLPVSERMQDDCTAAHLADDTLALFRDSGKRSAIVATFEQLHRVLQVDLAGHAGDAAAAAVADLIDRGSARG